jgi:FHA domain
LFNFIKDTNVIIILQSVNGVFINGIRVSKNEVKSISEGDVVGFGAAEATEHYYYVFKLARRTNLPTERMVCQNSITI